MPQKRKIVVCLLVTKNNKKNLIKFLYVLIHKSIITYVASDILNFHIK